MKVEIDVLKGSSGGGLSNGTVPSVWRPDAVKLALQSLVCDLTPIESFGSCSATKARPRPT